MTSIRTLLAPLALLASLATSAAASDWKPLAPAHLSLKEPKIDPSAAAEALLWEVKVTDDIDGNGVPITIYEHYLRAKIFTDRGREAFATIDIPFDRSISILDLDARTIRPNGTIVDVKRADIYERTVVKTGDVRVKVKSFAAPALEPGAIIEYKWSEQHHDSISTNLRLAFSRDIPVHEVRYLLKPLDVPGFQMVAFPFHGNFPPPVKQADGFTLLALSNVAAQASEEYSPPALEYRPWVFIGYDRTSRSYTGLEFERSFAKDVYEDYARRSRPNDAIRNLASEAVAGLSSTAAKVAALAAAARTRLKRTETDTAPVVARKAKTPKNAGEALSLGSGTGDDVLTLFLALASASRLEAYPAATISRNVLLPRSVRPHAAFFPERLAAVRNGDQWIIVEPANEYSASGEVPWYFELQRALIANVGQPVGFEIPETPASYSLKKRVGTFQLLDDGTLEGEARIEYLGHWGQTLREQDDEQSPADREKALRDLMTERWPGAELSDIRIENMSDLSKPYVNSYKVRIPGFAQRAGQRLILQPAVFQKGVAQTFAAAQRTTQLHFPFAFSEHDDVTITLPEGYSMQEAAGPKPINAGAGLYTPSISASGSTIKYSRKMSLATPGVYATTLYGPLRTFYESMHKADAHTVIVTRTTAP
jgi:hypothetical protein